MKTLGISVFTGMEQSVDQNINYIKMAAGLGYKALFTSLHIPVSVIVGLNWICLCVIKSRRNYSIVIDNYATNMNTIKIRNQGNGSGFI